MDAEFDELKREFLDEAGEKVREIRRILAAGDSTRESLDRLLYLSHQLKGAGGSYGYSRISTEAAAMEAAIERSLDALLEPSVDLRTSVESLASEIETRQSELGMTVPSSPQ